MLYREIIAVFPEIRTKYINSMQNVELYKLWSKTSVHLMITVQWNTQQYF
jgi:hypothetical protein